MKYRFSLCIVAMLILFQAQGQNRPWSLTLSPLSPLEDAYGLGIGYQWNTSWQVWLESVALLPFGGITYDPPLRGGFREILAIRHYVGLKKQFFVGGEVRLKFASYRDNGYILDNTLPGVAILMGSRFRLSKNGRLFMEWNLGPGLKYREVSWHQLPANPAPETGCGCVSSFTGVFGDQEKAALLPYISAALRIGIAF